MSQSDRRSVDALLAAARAKLCRVDPHTAAAMMRAGALLIDVRPMEQRERDGEVPGALIIGRNVLEWRLDPASPHRIPEVHTYHQPIVVMCAEGYSSSFAAAALHDLGLTAATDLIGGFHAWSDAGLPTRPVSKRRVLLRKLRGLMPGEDGARGGGHQGCSHRSSETSAKKLPALARVALISRARAAW